MKPRIVARAALAGLLLAGAQAQAREVWHGDDGSDFEVGGFYKVYASGVRLRPETVQTADAFADALDEARTLVPDPSQIPSGVRVPEEGVLNAHIARLTTRLRLGGHFEFEGAYQLTLSLASDPVFFGANTLGGTVSGANATGAQRRLWDLSPTLASGPTALLEQNLDRLAVKMALPIGDLTIGRQVLSWGTGHFWNPTDVLSPFPPTAIDREVRRGFDAARLAIALGTTTQLDLLYLPQPKLEDAGGVARFQTNVHGWDGSVSLGKYVRDVVAGADLAGDLGPVGAHAEGAYTFELLGLGKSDVQLGEHFFRGVVGFDGRPTEKLLLGAEYAYNGYGTTDPARYAQILTSPRVQRGEIFGAGRHSAALSATLLATDLLTAQLTALCNLTDPSALLIPSVEYSFSQSVLVRAGGSVPLGAPPIPPTLSGTDVLLNTESFRSAATTRGLQSEYGSSGYSAFVQVGLYVP